MHTSIKDAKKIIVFVKRRPKGKRYQSILSKKCSKGLEKLRRRKYNFTKISENNLNTRKVISLPQFNSNYKHTFIEGNKKMIKSSEKIMSQTSLNFRANKSIRRKNNFRSIYDYHNKSLFYTNFKIYRCQISANQDTCCCSCNSDAMFEVMKSLYDCYKKKNCDNCKCILCGHLPQKKRHLAKRSEDSFKSKTESTEKVDLSFLKGKDKSQKEKILKDMAMKDKSLPVGKTTSEKELVEKVRKSVGLPPAPKSLSDRKKYREAKAAGIIEPLEGKSHAEKEKILREQAALGMLLPEGRTKSENSIIEKVKAVAPPVSDLTAPSKQIKKAKKAGFLTPIKGKPREEKERILTGLATYGIPLPEVKSPSEKEIVDKISTNLGLPLLPTTPAEKEKYKKAYAAGLMTPLEGKSATQKEKILQNQAKMGIVLPVGRTTSEKALIEKVQQKIKAKPAEEVEEIMAPVHVPSEKMKKAKKAGFLTPLKGKTKPQREKILRGLALQGIPLPDGKTSSEIELIDNVRTTLGLPPEPESPIAKRKYKEAVVAGIITPLEGKKKPQKEKIIRQQAALGIQLPEGRTPSEKSIIAKIKSVAPPQSEIPVSSKKLKKAKEAGVLTPIKGKKPEEKEKILTGLAKLGIPLPEVSSSSEKKIVQKLTAELGLPPPPTVPAAKEKYNKAYAAGLMTPLEGKSASQKEKILQNQAKMGIVLPVGRTPSEKALIEKVQLKIKAKPADELEEIMAPVHVPSEKMKKAKKAGFLTPLKGKTKSQREKILRGLALQGIPLPEGKTSSEIKVIDNVRTNLGLPSEPKSPIAKRKYEEAVVAGIITPLEGKTKPQKEKIIREQAALGIPLPEGRTPSEKSIIAKIKSVAPPQSEIPVSSKKLKKAKEAGILTPIKGKKPEEKEKILTGLAKLGIPLPEVSSSSEKQIVEKLTAELGLPPPPTAPAAKEKYKKAYAAGLMTPLEGKSASQKEKILQNQAEMGIHLPVGRTPSEKALIEKVQQKIEAKPAEDVEELMAPVHVPSEKMKKAKEAGFLTPLKGKTKPQREKIIRGLALQGIPLPDGKTSSEIEILDNVRTTLGLPPEPKSPIAKQKYKEAVVAGIITPLEGKTKPQKEKIIREQAALGIQLPQGRTPSEKAIVTKIKSVAPPQSEIPVSSKKLKKAKEAGILTPIKGKKHKEKEKILTGLAKLGIPLPEVSSSSEKKIVEKLTADLGLPPPPTAPAAKEIYKKAYAAGLMTPLEGKSASQKEKILQNQAKMGIVLPAGRTPSEKALIEKVQQKIKAKPAEEVEELMAPVHVPSEKMKKAKEAGFLTPLKGKTKPQKEKILRGLALQGIPLPDGKTSSEIEVIDNVRTTLGLPPEPKSPIAKRKYKEAVVAGIITPLEGKTKPQKEKIIREQAALGIPLPEGRTPSEKSVIAKIKSVAPPLSEIPVSSKKLKKAKDAGILTPIKGKKPEEKEKILTGLAKLGIPLPEVSSSSEKQIVEKLTAELGLPPPPTAPAAKEKYKKAYAAGLMTPLEGKSASQKEKILQNQAEMGINLPAGRTPSEKALIEKVQQKIKAKPAEDVEELMAPVHVPSEKMKKAKEAGFLTPLKGKSKPQREKILRGLALQGIPLPDGKTTSEMEVIDNVRTTLGLPPEPKSPIGKRKYKEAVVAGIITPLEGKPKPQKEKIIRQQAALGIPLPEGRTPSEKAIVTKIKSVAPPQSEIPVSSKKLKKAKEAGILTPIKGKKHKEKEKILTGLAKLGIPLPEVSSSSEKKIVEKLTADLGLPPPPTAPAAKEKYKKAYAAGLMTPLEGKSASQKEKILQNQAEMGIHLPVGRTPSEKDLIEKVQQKIKAKPAEELEELMAPVHVPSEKMKKAKEAGFLTPLKGKTKPQREKILRGLALQGIPLPDGKTTSEMEVINNVRTTLGLPPEPKSPIGKRKYKEAVVAGIITPLEGKTKPQKEKLIREQAALGIPLPEGRTPSEKSIIAKIKSVAPPQSEIPVSSKKLKGAKDAGLLTPIKGKKREEKEKILTGLARLGIPLPEVSSPSEKKIVDKIMADLGIPPPPTTPISKERYQKAYAAGLITPLEGKSASQKEKILQNQANMGIILPVGRTPSEKALIEGIQAKKKITPDFGTLLQGKTPQQQEKIIKGLAMRGIQLPEARSPSEKKIIEKVRADVGLPPEPPTEAEKKIYKKLLASGEIEPLEGKSQQQKEKILQNIAQIGLQLPNARTPSEEALIAKVKATTLPLVKRIRSDKLRKAKAAGLMTPLEGKSQEQKEKIIKGLAMHGIPLPEVKTTSEKKIVAKVRKEIGLPPEPKQASEKENYKRALAAGIITPLEGKTASQKEQILRKQAKIGLTLPEGRTKSEKTLIEKVKLSTPKVVCECEDVRIPSQILKKAKRAGFLTPLEGKKKEQKENILKGLAMHGIPLPEGKTLSDNKLIEKVREDLGLPAEPKTTMEKKNYQKAIISGRIAPLEGKTNSQKENIIRNQVEMGLTVPKGRTASEKALIAKVKATAVEKPLTPLPSGKIRKAKETGYITPIEGKTKVEKEKIIKDMALHGIPLPVAKTKSEKKIMEQVSEELGLPPPPKTQKEAEKLKKAAENGFIVPLKGKSVVQKEKILRNQAAMDLPLPKGRTPSEKSLIKKIQASIGKAGSKAGIRESIQEITKLTKCDKSCGCNKKKIKFKHSYVKIRITSPDASSICPCPDECFPGVKGGVFMDNEGIKVTVGRAIDIAGFSSQERSRNAKQSSSMMLNTINPLYNEKFNVEFTTKSQDHLVNYSKNQNESDQTFVKRFSTLRINSDESFRSVMYSNIFKSFTLIKTKSTSSSNSSFFNNESNISFITPVTSNSSLLSLSDDKSIHINNEQVKSNTKSIPEYLLYRNSYDAVCVLSDIYLSNITSSMTTNNCKQSETMVNNINYDVYALGSTHSGIQEKHWNSNCDLSVPSSIHDDLENNEMKKLVKQIIANELNDHSSSFIVLVPTSSDDASGCSLYNLNSSVYMQVSKTCSFRCPVKNKPYSDQRNMTSGYQYSRNKERSEVCSSTPPCKISLYKNSVENVNKQGYWKDSHCPTHGSGENRSRIISTDTTLDRPCCCRDPGAVRDQMNPIGSPLIKHDGTGASYSNLRPYEMSSIRRHLEATLPKCEPCKCNLKIEIAKQVISKACGNSDEGIKNRSKKIDITVKTDGLPRDSLTTRRKTRTAISQGACNCPDGVYDEYDMTCQCEKPTKKYKHLVCECPEELPPVDIEDDFRYLRQVRSELTQSTSGFKLDVGPKCISDDSFEEILKYYAEQMEGKNKDRCICACDGGKSENKYNICACPEPKVSKTKRFNGLKFHIEGKGSGSKASNGILCLFCID